MNDTGRTTETFGRIDTDGTVYVRTSTGERAVGSWQAGTAEEGLAHFTRRYDDLATEVGLLESRLGTGAADPQATLASAERLLESLDTASVVGDLDALGAKLRTIISAAQAGAEKAKAARLAAREKAVERKKGLAAEAEQIAAESTQWKAAGDRLREILTEWKTIKGVDRKTDAELWRRYAAARDGFSKRRGGHFATLDAARKEAQGRKEELIAEATQLASSTDWKPTANKLKSLMAEWKTLPRASREAEDRLWKQFRAAMDEFFQARDAVFAERDAEFVENQKLKEALLDSAETLDVSDPKVAQARLRELQTRWDSIGRVPREAMAPLDRRLRAIEDRVRSAVDAQWQKAAIASNPLLAQMREQVAKAEQQLERAQASGDARRIAQASEALEGKRKFLELAEGAAS
ncbi:MAG: DUF349 domain-containing protein [Corynebacteriales bacterium]|nr:DUF349 domain-containing protein [Mycobacteriales bacterium]